MFKCIALMQRNYVNALIRGGILFVLFATLAATAQAVPLGGYIVFGDEIAVQLLLHGTPVTTAAEPGIPGSDPDLVGGVIGAGATSSVVDFAPFMGAFPPFNQNIVFNNQMVGVGGGSANFGLNYQNPLRSADPLNGHYIDFSGLVATLTGTSPLVGTAFDTTGLSIGFTAGSLDFPHSLSVDLSGNSALISGAGNGSFVKGTYTIPISVDIPLSTPYGNFDAVFTGTIMAASLPEPSTFILAALGVLALLLRGCRRRNVAPALIALAVFATDARAQVTMAWSDVGNPGNAPDTTGYGAVPNAYRIATYDVTNSQYVDFLNTVDPTGQNQLQLWNSNMGQFGGISFDASDSNGSKFIVIAGDGNHPVNFVTWYSAIRFTNWLDNGQTPGTTETGAYTLLGATPVPSNADSIMRNANATIFLPSEDEWYKAAYYNPATSSYFQFPTSSNTVPIATGPTTTPNSANYNNPLGSPTDVGAYTGTTSPYGAFDMGGNVFQWNEALLDGEFRGIRGGSFQSPLNPNQLQSSFRDDGFLGSSEQAGFGFRVASVPEQSTMVLSSVGALALLAFRWRRAVKSRA